MIFLIFFLGFLGLSLVIGLFFALLKRAKILAVTLFFLLLIGVIGFVIYPAVKSEGLTGLLSRTETFLEQFQEEDTKNGDLSSCYLEPLSSDATSTVSEGSTAYGAIIQLGDLDLYGRSTFAHIRLSDDQEPGNHGEERNEYINVDPAGWKNFKIHGNWVNNRCHLIGYQFSGLNDELRNLSIGTSYLNKGTEGSGIDEDNPDCMLFYEQRLDDWLYENPEKELDLYVRPIYEGANMTPTCYYMQWVGFDDAGEQVPIEIGGHSETVKGNIKGVLLQNRSPSCTIDYERGEITVKE